MSDPLSIVVVTRAKGELLSYLLDSLASQLASDDQVVVVDQGGYDSEIIQAWAGSPLGFRVEVPPDDGYRLVRNTNIGMTLARHDRTVKLDGDCKPRPGCLAAFRKTIEPGVIVAGQIRWQHQDGSLRPDGRFDKKTNRLRGNLMVEVDGEPLYANKVWGGAFGVWRPEFLALGGCNPAFDGRYGADEADLGWRYHLSGREIRFCGEAEVVHQWHPANPRRGEQDEAYQMLANVKRDYRNGVWPDPLVEMSYAHN